MNKSTERTKNYLEQVKRLGFAKILTVIANVAITGLLLRRLTIEEYGLWSLLISFASWISMFDLGLGNGLRIKVGEKLAKESQSDVGGLIFFCYFIFGVIALIICMLGFFVLQELKLTEILSIDLISENVLNEVFSLSLFFTLIMMVLNIIGAITAALQKSSYGAVSALFSCLLFLVLLIIFEPRVEYGVRDVLIFQFASILSLNLILTAFVFYKNKAVRPAINLNLNLKEKKEIFSLGGGFLLIQISTLLIFSTDKFLIVKLLGLDYVASYDIAFRIFNQLIVAHLIVSSPLLPAYTDAHHRGDLNWIKTALRKQGHGFKLFFLGAIFFMVVSDDLARLWSGGTVGVSIKISFSMAILTIVIVWNNIYGSLLNGLGLLDRQIKYALIGAIGNIPLSILFVKYFGLGVEGVVLATVCVLLIQSIGLYLEVQRQIYPNA